MRFVIYFLIYIFLLTTISCTTANSKNTPSTETEKFLQKKNDVEKDEKNKNENENKSKQLAGDKQGEKNKKDIEKNELKREEKDATYYDGLKYKGPAEKAFSEGLGKYFTDGCEGAVSAWKNAFEKDKERYQIAFNIALCYERLNNQKESMKWYEKAFLINPEFTKPLYNLALVFGKDVKDKADYFLELIGKTKDEVEKYNFIAWLYIQTGDLDKAEENAKKVLKLDEQNSSAVISLATVYYSKKMYELAQMALTTAEKWDSENFALQRLFGFLLYDMGDKKNAAVHLQKAIKINPELPEVRNILAVLSMEIEDFASAKEHLEFALRIAPDFRQAKVNLAMACKGLGDFKRARDLLMEVENDKNTDINTMESVLFNLGILYLDADVDGDNNPKKFDIAVDYFNKCLKLLSKKQDSKKEKVLVDGYIKEAGTEKSKLEFYIARKTRAEKKKKAAEEEYKLFLANKEKAFENAMKNDTVEVWEQYLKEYPLIDDNDKMGLAAMARLEELKKEHKEKVE